MKSKWLLAILDIILKVEIIPQLPHEVCNSVSAFEH